MCLCMFVYGSADVNTDTCRGWNRTLDPLELKLQVVVSCLTWVLGTKLRFSVRSVHTLPLMHHFSSPSVLVG